MTEVVCAACNSMVLAGEVTELRQTNERTRSQLAESQQREKVLVRRLAAKEQETQDYVVSTTATASSNVLICASVSVMTRVSGGSVVW